MRWHDGCSCPGMVSSTSVPTIAGREASYLLRLLALARARGFPLLPAARAVETIDGFRGLRRLAPILVAAGEEQLVPTLEASLARGSDPAAAGMLRALRESGLPADGLRELAAYLAARGEERSRFFRAFSYPLVVAATACFLGALFFQATVGMTVIGALETALTGWPGIPTPAWRLVNGVTRLVVGLLALPGGPFLYLLLVLAVAGLALRVASGLENGSSRLALLLLGRTLRLRTAWSFAEALGLLLPRMPLPEALALAASTTPNRVHRRRLESLSTLAASGESAGEGLRTCTALPPAVRWRLWAAYFRSDLPGELRLVARACRTELACSERKLLARATALSWLLALLSLFPAYLTAFAIFERLGRLFSMMG